MDFCVCITSLRPMARSCLLGGFLSQLRVNVDFDLFSHHRGRVFHSYTEVFAIDCGSRRESAFQIWTHLGWSRWPIHVESYLFCHTVNGEIADDFQLAVAILAHALRFESDGAKLCDIEVIRALQIVVAHLYAGVD